MTDQPPAANTPTPKPELKPVTRLPTVVTPSRPAGDTLARALGIVALLSSVAVGAYVFFRPAPPPPATAVSPQAWHNMEQRAEALAQEIASLRLAQQAAPATATAATETTTEPSPDTAAAIAALRDELANLKSSIGGAKETQQELTQLKNDLAVANTAISAVHGQVQKMHDSAHDATAAEATTRAQIIAYLQLRASAATATPFADVLQRFAATSTAVTGMATLIASLDHAAHGGVATLAMLQARFNVMAAPAEQAVAQAAANTWWERLAASMQDVISVRKIDHDNGGGSKTLRDAAATLQRGDLADTLRLIDTLPPEAQKQLQEWSHDAKARVDLDAKLAQIGALLGATSTAAAVPESPPAPAVNAKEHNAP